MPTASPALLALGTVPVRAYGQSGFPCLLVLDPASLSRAPISRGISATADLACKHAGASVVRTSSAEPAVCYYMNPDTKQP